MGERNTYIDRDLDLCENIAYQYFNNPNAADGILLRCFSKEDRDRIDRIMKTLYPEVKIYYEWFTYNTKD